MDDTTISAKKYIIKYGIILGIIFVLYNVIIHVTDSVESRNWIHTVLDLTLRVAIITYGIYNYKFNNNGLLKLTEALKIGIGIAIIGGIFAVGWNLILTNIIEPDMINQKLVTQQEQMIKNNPDMSQEQINQSMEMVKKFSTPYITSALVLIWNSFLGLIISLIGGAIMQRNKDVF